MNEPTYRDAALDAAMMVRDQLKDAWDNPIVEVYRILADGIINSFPAAANVARPTGQKEE